MNEKYLLKISLIIAITGILFLLILSNLVQPDKIKIKDISERYIDKKIQTQGQIISIKTFQQQNFQILTIADKNKTIEAVYNPNNNINLTKNQTVIITGTVSQYKESLQIQADKIEILNLKTSN